MQNAFDTTFESRLAKLDLTNPMKLVAMESGMSHEELATAEDLYRKFLTLKAENPEMELTPPVIVDYVWEAHLKFSRQYMADCDMLFGEYMHHNPQMEEGKLEAPFAATRELFQKNYGISFTRAGLRPELCASGGCI
jgi:hypothetical protein